ncbi:uncharacterized protein LOC116853077 [Odontomachus brunneus]|uniref:uncharacterized protein LOC116853077 n=1 Tax=Odontomachus brunneus TaxID=486640 RepID=UPI0013F1D1B0|nr:uncharacterized protein LOC116853077 [Odontomachus brunneus]
MKTLEIIACLLAIIMVAHTYSYSRSLLFQENLIKCSKKLNEKIIPSESSHKLLHCALKNIEVFDEDGWLIKEKMYRVIIDSIPNKRLAQSSLHLFAICYTYADSLRNVSTAYKTMHVFNCSSPIVSHFMVDPQS